MELRLNPVFSTQSHWLAHLVEPPFLIFKIILIPLTFQCCKNKYFQIVNINLVVNEKILCMVSGFLVKALTHDGYCQYYYSVESQYVCYWKRRGNFKIVISLKMFSVERNEVKPVYLYIYLYIYMYVYI